MSTKPIEQIAKLQQNSNEEALKDTCEEFENGDLELLHIIKKEIVSPKPKRILSDDPNIQVIHLPDSDEDDTILNHLDFSQYETPSSKRKREEE